MLMSLETSPPDVFMLMCGEQSRSYHTKDYYFILQVLIATNEFKDTVRKCCLDADHKRPRHGVYYKTLFSIFSCKENIVFHAGFIYIPWFLYFTQEVWRFHPEFILITGPLVKRNRRVFALTWTHKCNSTLIVIYLHDFSQVVPLFIMPHYNVPNIYNPLHLKDLYVIWRRLSKTERERIYLVLLTLFF